MISHLFIVARGEAELYAYLLREFATEEDVRVIMDRRVAERRTARRPPDVERRHADRRSLLHVSRQLSSLGYAFVRVDA